MFVQAANQAFYTLHLSEIDDESINVISFQGKEQISGLYEYRIQLGSNEKALESSKILNQPATLTLVRGEEEPAKINGIITHFKQKGISNDYVFYEVVLNPKLWLLNLVFQNQVFQNVNIEDLIKLVLKDSNIPVNDFKIDLKNSYPQREYIVQYRESNFNFLNRRLEHCGIYYYFDNKSEKDIVVFTDTNNNLPSIDIEEPLGYNLNRDPSNESESIHDISCTEKLVTGMVKLKDYNYLFPERELIAESQINSNNPGLYYDFGDNFPDVNGGEFLAKMRDQEFISQSKVFYGTSDCRLLRAGSRFKMEKHFRDDWNDEYIITGIQIRGNQNNLLAITPEKNINEPNFECKFEAIPFNIEFRPLRKTFIPKISGIMSAKLESGSGDEYAFIDDDGRYKAKMFFDISDKSNGEATLPIRLAQGYSGPGYGIHFPNHADTELLWSCLNGDVDRPVGLGTVPNPSNASPSKSGNKSQSVIRTAGQNELTFDDKTGSENIYIHGTKDWTIDITHDKNQNIGNDETASVGNNRSRDVGKDESINIGNNLSENIGKNSTISIGENSSVSIGKNLDESVGSNLTESIGGNGSISVGKNMDESIGENYSLSAGKNSSESVGKDKSESIGENYSANAGKNYTCQSGKNMTFTAGENFGINGGKKGVIEIADELSIKCGSASITLKKNGDITIKGNKISIKGSGDVTVKGSKIGAN